MLQHPSEAKNSLGSARLLSLAVSKSVHRVGLSWRSLSHALGEDRVDPHKWAVLFVGTKKTGGKPYLDKNRYRNMEGLVLLDGNWKQSKTLWWRNPWLLKAHRLVLAPSEPSHYGQLRQAPRQIWLSTLEAAAEALVLLGEPEAVHQKLVAQFDAFLARASSRSFETPTVHDNLPAVEASR